MKMLSSAIFIFLIQFLISCSSTPSRPQLFPNQTLKEKGQEASQKDIDQCLKEANDYLKTSEGQKLEDSYSSSSVSSSVGIGFGGMGSSVGLGVGVGGTPKSRLSGEERVRRNYTNQCLLNKGYQIVGWED